MKKIRLSDIAKEVGCSTATVSYVLNNDPRQKINEETKKKILQTALVLGYKKNTIANALSNGKHNSVGLYVGKSLFPLAAADKSALIGQLVEALALNGYRCILLAGAISKEIPFVDAIICVDFAEDDFTVVCKSNYIPVIGLDTHVHESWIFEISSTLSSVQEKFLLSDYILLHYDMNSENLKKKILANNEHTYFISSFSQLDLISNRLSDKKVIVYGDALFDYLKNSGNNFIKYPTNNVQKINKLVACLRLALEHTDVDVHVYSID